MIAPCVPNVVLPSPDGLIAPETAYVVPAHESDAERLGVLHAEAFRRGWTTAEFACLLIAPNVIADRAMLGTRLAGFILSRAAADEAEVLSLAVATPYRQQGLARRLLSTHMYRLAAAGVRTLFLEVDERNAPARRLYDASGFQEVSRRKDYYAGHGREQSAALVLRRDLAGTGTSDCGCPAASET